MVQEVFGLTDEQEKHESSLARADLAAIQAKITSADFATLKKSYDHPMTDNPTLILTITANNKTKAVSVYAPSHLRSEEDVKRFLQVWSEVLRKVPAPNPEQKPDMYQS